MFSKIFTFYIIIPIRIYYLWCNYKVLREWEEAIGLFKGIEFDAYSVAIKLEFPNKSSIKLLFFGDLEKKIIITFLKDVQVGNVIGLLKTDLLDKPVTMRILKRWYDVIWK